MIVMHCFLPQSSLDRKCNTLQYVALIYLERIEVLEAMKITQVSCGESFTVVLNSSGQVYSFGDNSKGQLGQGIKDQSKHIPR